MLPQRYFITAGFELTEVYIFVCVQNAIHSITAQLRRGELALPAGRSLTRSGRPPKFSCLEAHSQVRYHIALSPWLALVLRQTEANLSPLPRCAADLIWVHMKHYTMTAWDAEVGWNESATFEAHWFGC